MNHFAIVGIACTALAGAFTFGDYVGVKRANKIIDKQNELLSDLRAFCVELSDGLSTGEIFNPDVQERLTTKAKFIAITHNTEV